MTNARNLIGFDTPSKAKAQEEMSKKTDTRDPQINRGVLMAETIKKIEQYGNVILGEVFSSYTAEQKAKVLMEFVYLTKVADSLQSV